MHIILLVLTLLTVLSAIRILIGPTFWDRLLGLNLVTTKLIMLIVLIASLRKVSYLLDIALVYALLGFIGVIFLSITVQRKG